MRRVFKANCIFGSNVGWEVKPPSLAGETATSRKDLLLGIPRVKRSESAGYFLSLISPPLVVL